ncbi:hypothetical protein [Aliarcobacter butzleri]|uniref:hypothetical protein n=1 Tax=Aliarcobacter butzleri TaxID=28197 RepID=UPI001EDB9172|nr:hypothetical protein [Aliarcobacter butzleri]MCG3660093.1 hypothetical protein [Aliarcobacter butzleri]
MIKLYIQDENYHFQGSLSGVLVDEENKKVALFSKEDIEENIKLNENIEWFVLEQFSCENNNVIVKAENYKFYKEFYCLGIKEIE